MREAFVFVLFLYNARAIPLQLNKHCSVAKSVIQFLQLADEDGPSFETWSEAIFIQGSLLAKKRSHKSQKQLSLSRNYSYEPKTNFRVHIRVLLFKNRKWSLFYLVCETISS